MSKAMLCSPPKKVFRLREGKARCCMTPRKDQCHVLVLLLPAGVTEALAPNEVAIELTYPTAWWKVRR